MLTRKSPFFLTTIILVIFAIIVGTAAGSEISDLLASAKAMVSGDAAAQPAAGSRKNAAPLACVGAPSGMTAWWKGEGNGNDIAGGNTATLSNISFVTGEVGQAFKFSGSQSSNIGVPTSSSIDIGKASTAGSTIDMWINPSSSDINGSTSRPLAEYNTGTNVGLHFYLNIDGTVHIAAGALFANLVDTTGTNHFVGSGGGAVTANTWQHVAVTYDKTSGNATLYVNGVQVAGPQNIGANLVLQTTYQLNFGVRTSGGITPYAGAEDEIELFNRALSQSEIQTIFNAGSAGKCSPTISVSPGTLTFGNQTVGTYSPAQSYNVSGSTLQGNITVTPPTDFQVSTDQFNNFGAQVTLTPSSGTVASTAVWVRYAPSSAGANTGNNVANTSTNAPTQNVALSGTGVAATCTPPPAGMVAWYSGENNTNDRINGINGSTNGGVSYAAGEVNQAFNFNFGFVSANAASGPLNITGNQVTIDGWIKPTNLSGLRVLFGRTANSANDYLLLQNGGALQAIIKTNGVETYIGSAFTIPIGIWSHVALVYNGSTMKIYANGQEVSSASKTGNIDNTGAPFDIGGRNGGLFFSGMVDEVEVFNRALAPAEIANIYNAGSAGKCPCGAQPSGMINWYTADGHALDVRSGENGTLQNGAGFGGGEVGSGFSLDGVSATVTAPATRPLTSSFSVGAWIDPSTLTGIVPVVFERGPTNTNRIGLQILSDGSMCGYVDSGACTVTAPAGTVVPGSFTYVVLVFDDALDQEQLFANGVMVGSAPDARTPGGSVGTLTIGDSPVHAGAGEFFNGVVDDLQIFNRALSATEIQGIYNGGSLGQCTCTAPANGPLGWWPADGDARDISGNGNDGTLVNGAGFAVGKVGQAFKLDGASNQYVLVGDGTSVPAALQVQNEISLEAWIYATAYPPDVGNGLAEIIGSQHDGTFSGATIFLDGRTNPDGQSGVPPGHIHFQIGNGSWHATNSQAQVPLNQWVHIVATRKPGEDGKIYYNGVLQPVASAAWSGGITYNGSWFAIGQQNDQFRPFTGLIDEASIYDRALTGNEVTSIFNAGIAGKYKSVAVTADGPFNGGGDATATFTGVTAPGILQEVPIDGSKYPTLPSGQTSTGLYYDVSASAAFTGGVTVCFHLPFVTTSQAFSNLRVDHFNGTQWGNVTGTSDFTSRTLCTTSLASLSPFAIASVNGPSAAGVSITGRVMARSGSGIRNAAVFITDAHGITRHALTNAFGYYTFTDVPAGGSYVIGVDSRLSRYQARVIQVNDTLAGVDFTPIE